MLEFAAAIIPLIYLLFKEYFSHEAKARQADQKFKLDQIKLRQIIDAAMQQWIARSAKESVQISNVWGIADKDAEETTNNKETNSTGVGP